MSSPNPFTAAIIAGGGPAPEVTKPSFVAYEVDGGLDLVTSLTHVRPGSMVMCQNYEVARQRGARRIDGYEMFDGGSSPTSSQFVTFNVASSITPPPVTSLYTLVGTANGTTIGPFRFTLVDYTANGISSYTIRGFFQQKASLLAINAFLNGPGSPSLTMSLPLLFSYTTITNFSALTFATNAALLAYISAFYTTQSALIQPVPGQGNVNGLFYLKDTVYATRDLQSVTYSVGTNIANLQDVLYQGASFAAATWKGTVAKLTQTSGSFGVSNDAAGVVMVYNTTGTLTAAVVNNNSQAGVVFATASLAIGASTAAGLYKATGQRGTTVSQSWQWQDLGWTVPYTNGGVTAGLDFLDMNLALSNSAVTSAVQSTSWHTATVATGNAWTFNGTATNLVQALSAGTGAGDTAYAAWSGLGRGVITTSGPISATAFGFTAVDIPATATITGFELQVNCGAISHGAVGTMTIVDGSIALLGINDGVNHNFALANNPWTMVATPTATSYTNRDYGGAQTLLGYGNASQANIVSAGFGLRYNFSYQNPILQTGAKYIDAHINNIQMRVWFVPQTNGIYFYNSTDASPTAVRAVTVQHYIQTGTLLATNAAGTLYFQFQQANGTMGGQPSRPIGGGEMIYQYPANGVAPNPAVDKQLGLTSAAPAMNVMDWSSLIAAPPLQDGTFAPAAKYEHITKNFYASSGYEAIFGVSGAGPAFYYDGTNFSRILTGLTGVLESPRHITEHQGHLVLGYYSGLVEWSNTDNVLTFNPILGNRDAGGEGFGERINGIRSLNGDSLAVWTRGQLKMIQGQLDGPTPAYVSIISPTSGGIEYTMQPMSTWMYADFRGITSIGATQKYGDFEIGHLSSLVAPFLTPRLQLSTQFEAGDIGSINSILIRNKNQYRLFFADGVVMTVTFLVDGDPPQFSTQKYFHSDSITPLTWDVIIAGTESTGRDHIYGATADGTGNVFELERGLSFNGGAIPAFVLVAGNDLQAPYDRKMFFDVGIHGVAQDYATFTMSRSPDYNVPTSSVAIPMVFGSSTAVPFAVPNNEVIAYVSFNTLQMEGRSINLRFDSSLNNQFPHAIQSVVLSAKALDDKRT